MTKKMMPGYFALAFVWFTTHFGGGFASGAQLNSFFIKYGSYALIMPVVSQLILATVFYFAWNYEMDFKLTNYRSWTNKFYSPYEGVMSNVYDVMYHLLLVVATAVAFATGGATLETIFGTRYSMNTILIALVIFLLTIFGATVVRKAATGIALSIIFGMLIIFVPNIVAFWPQLMGNIQTIGATPASSAAGLWPAFWKTVIYAGFQASAMGAYIGHTMTLENKSEVKKSAMWGFVINGGLMFVTTLGLMTFYSPELLAAKVPTLYVVMNGVGSVWMKPLVSVLIVLGAVSTGVNLIYGMVNRITQFLSRNESEEVSNSKQKVRSVVSAVSYIAVAWGVAQFGLIPLIAKGYGYIGVVSVFVIIIPILAKGFMGWKKDAPEATEVHSKILAK